MKKEMIRMVEITPTFDLDVVDVDVNTLDLFDGDPVEMVAIGYPVLLENLKKNSIFSHFSMLVDDNGKHKQLPLNLIGTVLYSTMRCDDYVPIVGNIYIVKYRGSEFVDMFDRELEVLKSQLSGMIDLVLENLSDPNPDTFGTYS